MQKSRILLLFGGRSVEHEISIKSSKNVLNYLDKDKFEPVLVGITKSGQWFLQHEIRADIIEEKPLSLDLSATSPTLKDIKSGASYPFDVAFPVLHGTDGEDGSIQGLFTTVNAPVVGSDVLGSAASMNKLVTKQLLTESGIPNTKYLSFDYSEKDQIRFEDIEAEIGMPVIIKPVNLGSSVGVSKAVDKSSFEAAVEDTFRYDNLLLIEEFIEGREFEIAVLGNEDAKATVPGEVVISDEYEFYDFNAKYVDDKAAEIVIPANLSPDIIDIVKTETIKAYKALRCCDYARVDFFIDEDNKVYINEINTIPGFTNISMFPKLWEFEGIDNRTLITTLINTCMQRFKQKNRIITDFDSDLK